MVVNPLAHGCNRKKNAQINVKINVKKSLNRLFIRAV